MKVKKYVGPSMRDALEKMKKDLGTGAVILGSRKISRGGFLDFLGKEMFEVTATTEENILVDHKRTAKTGSPADSPGDRVDPNTTDSPFAGVGSLWVDATSFNGKQYIG